jgi:heat shock protein HslJ
MKPASIVMAAAALAFGLAACGESEPAADAPTTTRAPTTTPASVPDPPPDLDGRVFVSTAVTGHRLVDGTTVRLAFDGDQLGASAGCNQVGGTWSIDGGALAVPDDMVMTEMACDPPALMEQDTWLASFLSSRPTIVLRGDTLTLTGRDATINLLDREVADPDRPLEGTEWVVDGLVSGDAVSSVPSDIRVPTLQFDGGQVAVDAGCNTGSGRYDAKERDITFGPIATTRMACGEPTMEVEAHVLGVVDGTASYEIEAGVLTLTNGDTGLVLRATQ